MVQQALELNREACAAPTKIEYVRYILTNAAQRQGFSRLIRLMRWADILPFTCCQD